MKSLVKNNIDKIFNNYLSYKNIFTELSKFSSLEEKKYIYNKIINIIPEIEKEKNTIYEQLNIIKKGIQANKAYK